MVYHCRLCDRTYRHGKDVIGIFSEEGKTLGIASKIVYALSILVTENDPTSKYVCKGCWSRLKITVTFTSTCHAKNTKIVDSIINKPSNTKYKEEIVNFYKIPIHLVIRHYTNISLMYSSLVFHLRNKFGHEDTDLYVRNLHKNVLYSFTNRGYNKNNATVSNGMPPNPLVNGLVNGDTSSNENVFASRISNDHNYGAHSRSKLPTTNGLNDQDEVICLDDDDDVDSNDDLIIDSNDHPVVDINLPVNKWVMHTPVSKNVSTENVHKNPPNNLTRIYVKKKSPSPPLPVIKNHFSLPSSSTSSINSFVETNVPNSPQRCISRSSNVSAEEISVTPDIEPLNMNSSVIPVSVDQLNKPRYYLVMPSNTYIPNPPPQVLPETGVHFLTNFCIPEPPMVDLTSSDEPTRKPKAIKNKRRITQNDKSGPPPKKINCPPRVLTVDKKSKPVVQKLPVKKVTTNLRPKRPSTTNVDHEIKKSSLYKLGHQEDTNGWHVMLDRLSMSHYQCPICITYFKSPKKRQLHENKDHILPPVSACSSVNSDSPSDNKSIFEKLEFLNYLNLGRMSKSGQVSNHKNITNRLAQRKNFLNAIKTFGDEISSYECKFCKYKTSRKFILWAHISINHEIISDSDSKSNSFCFICERVLNKRTQLLKHIDKCLINLKDRENKDCTENECEENECKEKESEEKESEDKESEEIDCASKTSSSAKYMCSFCKADNFDSLLLLEQHLWNHVAS